MTPESLSTGELKAGHVGYIITSSRDVKSARIGDTLHNTKVSPGGTCCFFCPNSICLILQIQPIMLGFCPVMPNNFPIMPYYAEINAGIFRLALRQG